MAPINIQYSEKLIRNATRYYWWYSVGAPYLFVLIPFILLLAYRLLINDYSWIVWVCGFIALYCSAAMAYLFFEYMNRQISWGRSMTSFKASVELKENSLQISSNAEPVGVQWESICDIRHYKNYWILVLSPRLFEFVILPVNELTHDIKTSIESNVQSILYTTGQSWKIRTELASTDLGLIFFLVPHVIDSFPRQWVIPSYLVGGLFGIISLFLLFNIRCPKCQANWNSQASRPNPSGRWPFWLRSLRKCSRCGASGSDFRNDGQTKATL